MRRVVALFLCLLFFPCVASADLTIYFLDVGQGDSSIIVCDGEAMIIDGGLPAASDKVYTFLKNDAKVEKLEYMVATHPDEDHIGGLTGALNAVPVETILSPVKEWNTSRFQTFKNYTQKQGTPIVVPYVGDTYYLGRATFTILACDTSTKDPNQMSICLRLDYEETSFLFTGDLGGYAEYSLTMLDANIKADVLKVSHHGSSDSNSYDFLELVSPEYAIISCGSNNKYGHPNQRTLDSLSNLNVDVYRTDLQGTITCKSDGKTISIKPEHAAQSNVFKAPEK